MAARSSTASKSVLSFNINARIVSTFFPVDNYALAETLTSGQAFRWKVIDGGWESVIGARWVRLIPETRGIRASTISEDADLNWDWLTTYLQLPVNPNDVIATFPTDEHLRKAVQCCRGLRLLKQEPWECLASFILSSTKQIVQIQHIVALVCERFGDPVPAPPGRRAFAFPSAERIGSLSEADLRCCKMGFRAPYVKGTAEMITRREADLEAISRLDLDAARAELMRFPGVGRKIADCVLLFAYGFPQAFPVDVWVLKAIRQLYFPRRRPNAKKIIRFTETYFGPNAGYAQQYLFHYMRTRLRRASQND
jgi:N-glycosylase/DNA lyase